MKRDTLAPAAGWTGEAVSELTELTEIVRGGFDSDGSYLGNPEYVLALCEEAERLEDESRWIPVTERLPGHDGPVLVVVDGCVTAFESFYAADGFEGPSDCSITHWRPLPVPPEERT